MARNLEELIRDAAQLSDGDRATLAAVIIDGLEAKAPTDDVKAAWSREVERRIREIDDGAVQLVEWDVVRAELFADE